MASLISAASLESYLHDVYKLFHENPLHVVIELVLVGLVITLLLQKAYKPRNRPEKLSAKEVDQLIEEWQPEPLAPTLTEDEQWMATPDAVLTGPATAHSEVEGVGEVINFSAMDFLGLVGNPSVIERAVETVQKYGIGSCGPRGFYGTVDVHLDLEKQLSKFMGTDEAILYASGFNTIASAIPAFLKMGDLVLCDEAVYLSIQQGVQLARCEAKYFRHNDMAHLEELLRAATMNDSTRRTPLNRRFIIVEGIYKQTGDMAPLKEIVALKEKYRFRLMMDESVSLGVLGATGRGLAEELGIPRSKIDVTTAALSNAFCSVGGFCCGSHQVVDHQRLSGAAYCFSASVVPYLATAASQAVSMLDAKPELVKKLRQNSALAHKLLSAIPSVKLCGDIASPLLHLRIADASVSAAEAHAILRHVAEFLLRKKHILVSASRTVQERVSVPPSIRVCISAAHTAADLEALAAALREGFDIALRTASVQLPPASAPAAEMDSESPPASAPAAGRSASARRRKAGQ